MPVNYSQTWTCQLRKWRDCFLRLQEQTYHHGGRNVHEHNTNEWSQFDPRGTPQITATVSVFWHTDGKYYDSQVVDVDEKTRAIRIEYEDGETENYVLNELSQDRVHLNCVRDALLLKRMDSTRAESWRDMMILSLGLNMSTGAQHEQDTWGTVTTRHCQQVKGDSL